MKTALSALLNFVVKHAAEIVARLQTASPPIFKALQKIFGILAVLAGILQEVIAKGVWIPAQSDTILQWCTYILAIAATGFGISALPVADQDKKEEKKEAIKSALSTDVVGDRPPPRKPPGAVATDSTDTEPVPETPTEPTTNEQ